MVAIWMFALGLLTVSALPFLIPFSPLVGLAFVLLLAARYAKVPLSRTVNRYAFYYILGLLINSLQLQTLSGAQVDHSFDNTWQMLTFKIVSVPQQRQFASVFLADVQTVHCEESPCPDIGHERIRLSWYRSGKTLAAGQVWSAKIKLKRPRGFVNPDGFDYHAWLLSQNVIATGYVHSEAVLQEVSPLSWVQVRQALGERVDAAAGDGRYKRFWATLLVADRSGITASDWHTLQATGTVHLMAISGLHIGLVSLWAFWFGRLLGRAGGVFGGRAAVTVMHWLPPLLSCSMAGLYAGLAGFSIPTVRALVACLLVNACWLLGLRIAPPALLGVGVAVVALGEPLAGQNNGFWLSFSAVFLLIYTLNGRLVQHRIFTVVWLQLVLSFGLSVPLLWLGQGVSWVSPFANVVAVPVVSFVIVPGLFLAALGTFFSSSLAHYLLNALDWVFHALWHYLLWLETAPAVLLWPPKALGALPLSLAFVGILLLFAPTGMRVRGLGAIVVGIALAIKPRPPPQLRMTVMDVGQGLAMVVQTPAHTWVYDTGPSFSETFDAGSRIVAPYLRAQGVRDISLMVSHGDNDHSGGTAGLLPLFNVTDLVVGEYLALSEGLDERKQQLCERGQRWQLDSLELRVLWPPSGGAYEGNSASCVALLQMPLNQASGSGRATLNILLTGDIDRSVEAAIMSLPPPLLPERIDVLVAPHHGSKSSSGADFVRRVNPRVVVFSAGYKNRYNHPHPQVVARYEALGARSYNIATSGAVVFEWRDGEATIVETRAAEAKLWYR